MSPAITETPTASTVSLWRVLAVTARIAFPAGFLYGTYASAWLGFRGPIDLATLPVYCGLEIAVVATAAAAFLHGIQAVLRRLRPNAPTPADDLAPAIQAIQVLLVLWAVFNSVGEIGVNRLVPLGLRTENEVFLRAGFFLSVLVLFGILLRWWLLRLRRPGTQVRRRVLVGFLACAALAWIAAAAIPADAPPPPIPVPDAAAVPDTGLRVCLVGIDGASWKFVEPLLREGKLPWLEDLERRGARGTLASEEPYSSPCLWVTISTGVPRAVHGIDDYIYVAIPGVRRFSPSGILREPSLAAFLGLQLPLFAANWIRFLPPSRDDCRAPMLWERTSALGFGSAVVNWTGSWPARPVKGALISDRGLREIMWTLLAPEPAGELAWPPECLERLAPEFIDPKTEFSDACRSLAAFTPEELDHMAHAPLTALEWDPLPMLRRMFHIERNCLASFGRLSREAPFRLGCLQLDANDMVSHSFWPYRFPTDFADLDPDKIKRYGDLLRNFWIDLDARLARTVPAPDERTVVLVFSDHGFVSMPHGYPHRAGHEREGILIAAGGPVRAGVRLAEHSIYDLAPTALHLLGMPVPKEMTGRVMQDALAEEFLRRFPPRTTAGGK